MNKKYRSRLVMILAVMLLSVSSAVFANLIYVVPTDLFGVFEIENEIWVCGANGAIFHSSDRVHWEVQTSGVDVNLTSLFFINKKKGFCVGYHGTLLKTDDGGRKWVKVPVESGYYFTAIQFVNDVKGFVAGEFGTLLTTNDAGNTWQKIVFSKEAVDVIFNDIGFFGKENGWIIGEFGKVLRTVDGGKTWKNVDLGIGECMLFGISVLDKNHVVVTGADGLVCRTEDGGKSWKKVDLGVKNQIFGVRFTSAQTGYVFGKNIIFKTDDGGKIFRKIDLGKELNYGWIYRMSQTIAVGNNGTIYRLDKNNWSVVKIAGLIPVFEGKK